MKNYNLTVENGVITRIETADENGNPIEGVLYIPKEAVAFGPDAWARLGCSAEAIVVDEDNPFFSSAHNCLLSKDGKTLIKTCKTSDISKLTSLETIGQDAFNDLNEERDEFVLKIPDGVITLDYRAFAVSARKVSITVPSSVKEVGALAFMIHSESTRIIFEGDADLEIGTFGTEAESFDSDYDIYKSLPANLYPKKERITVSCPADSKISDYCREYGIKND